MKQIPMAAGLILICILLTACASGYQLTYKVHGDASETAVSYLDANGRHVEETVNLPWETSIGFDGRYEFSITVESSQPDGTVVCEVWVDERPLGSRQGRQLTECSGSIQISSRGGATETSSTFNGRSDQQGGAVDLLPTPPGADLMATAAANLEAHQAENESTQSQPAQTLTPEPVGFGLIALISNRNGVQDIYLMDVEGKVFTQITQGAGVVGEIGWMLDGRYFAFSAAPEGESDIYTFDTWSKGFFPAVDGPGEDLSPSFSPDGRYIVFSSNREDGLFQIFRLDRRAYKIMQLTEGDHNCSDPMWSPVEELVAYVCQDDAGSGIYVMEPNGDTQIQLNSVAGVVQQPVWSPDGSMLAYSLEQNGRFAIHVMDANGQNSRRLTTSDLNEYAPAWSPDGRQLLFQANNDIYRVNLDGTNLVNLTQSRSEETHYFAAIWHIAPEVSNRWEEPAEFPY